MEQRLKTGAEWLRSRDRGRCSETETGVRQMFGDRGRGPKTGGPKTEARRRDRGPETATHVQMQTGGRRGLQVHRQTAQINRSRETKASVFKWAEAINSSKRC